MKTKKEPFFDLPMILSLIAVCGIMLFIIYAGKKNSVNTDKNLLQRDTVELVVPKSHGMTFLE